MIFQSPIMLCLLVLIPVLATLITRAHRLRANAAATLRGPAPETLIWKRRMARYLAAFAALILALARPGWNPHPGPPASHGRDLVLALDISRSMLAADVFPSRLEAARIALHEGLVHMRDQRIGLILFAGAASVRVPLTRDHHFVRYMLDRASPAEADVGSTSLQSAIEKAVDVVLKESKQGQQDLIIFTDGEDHMSDIDATSETLSQCGARVLIIGLGDPVAGARIPDAGGTNTWMQYKGEDVISRLSEKTLVRLAEQCPNVIYHSAATAPFDLLTLYNDVLSTPTQLEDDADTKTLMYTEGYPFLLALALLLLFFPFPRAILPFVCIVLMAGCSSETKSPPQNYLHHLETGQLLWADAQTPMQADPRAALSLLLDARESFLHAALSRPGDEPVAGHIVGVTLQIRKTEAAIVAQDRQEEDLQQRLQDAIERLKVFTEREDVIARRSQTLLRKRPNATQAQKSAAVPPTLMEQSELKNGTVDVLGVLHEIQSIIRDALSAAYGKTDTPPATEYDAAINTLTSATQSQRAATDALTPDAIDWPKAASAMLTAHRNMQTTLQLLSEQSQSQEGEQDSESDMGDNMDWEYEEDMEWSETDAPSDRSMPMSSQNFKTALENRSLPSPNYTSEEVLMQEAANQEQRAQQKAGRAGAHVEKNW